MAAGFFQAEVFEMCIRDRVNNELLTKLITMDQGSCYLGECALVPFDSPINQSGLLFYLSLIHI